MLACILGLIQSAFRESKPDKFYVYEIMRKIKKANSANFVKEEKEWLMNFLTNLGGDKKLHHYFKKLKNIAEITMQEAQYLIKYFKPVISKSSKSSKEKIAEKISEEFGFAVE